MITNLRETAKEFDKQKKVIQNWIHDNQYYWLNNYKVHAWLYQLLLFKIWRIFDFFLEKMSLEQLFLSKPNLMTFFVRIRIELKLEVNRTFISWDFLFLDV